MALQSPLWSDLVVMAAATPGTTLTASYRARTRRWWTSSSRSTGRPSRRWSKSPGRKRTNMWWRQTHIWMPNWRWGGGGRSSSPQDICVYEARSIHFGLFPQTSLSWQPPSASAGLPLHPENLHGAAEGHRTVPAEDLPYVQIKAFWANICSSQFKTKKLSWKENLA